MGRKAKQDDSQAKGYICQCGRSAPDAVLHVDHVISVADGGQDNTDNLITACSRCNLGKGSKSVER